MYSLHLLVWPFLFSLVTWYLIWASKFLCLFQWDYKLLENKGSASSQNGKHNALHIVESQ